MNNFYDKKRIELTEEIKYLGKRKDEIAELSDEKRAEIITELNKLDELKNEEIAIMKRFKYLRNAELGIYRVFLPARVFISSVNGDISNILDRVEYMFKKDDENE